MGNVRLWDAYSGPLNLNQVNCLDRAMKEDNIDDVTATTKDVVAAASFAK